MILDNAIASLPNAIGFVTAILSLKEMLVLERICRRFVDHNGE